MLVVWGVYGGFTTAAPDRNRIPNQGGGCACLLHVSIFCLFCPACFIHTPARMPFAYTAPRMLYTYTIRAFAFCIHAVKHFVPRETFCSTLFTPSLPLSTFNIHRLLKIANALIINYLPLKVLKFC